MLAAMLSPSISRKHQVRVAIESALQRATFVWWSSGRIVMGYIRAEGKHLVNRWRHGASWILALTLAQEPVGRSFSRSKGEANFVRGCSARRDIKDKRKL
jgi:hypothetical protein